MLVFIISICFLIVLNIPYIHSSAEGKEPVGEELRIGVLGVFSGHAAAWGLTSKYTAMVQTKRINQRGGFLLNGVRHPIKLFIEDSKFDVKVTRAAAEKLIYQNKVKYIIGPNTSPTGAAVSSVGEPAKVINIGYGFTVSLYTPEHPYTIMGMVTPDQSAPVIYKYLMDTHNVKSISLVAKNYAGSLNTRKSALKAANALGLKVVSAKETYEPDATDFFPVMSKVVKGKPDVIDLTAAGAGDAAQAVKAARQLGFKGVICMETVADAQTFNEIAGKYAEGLICVASPVMPEIRTQQMEAFMEEYKKEVGEWNDEAGTKVYALDMILETIKAAGEPALTDTDAFRAAMPKVGYKSPYLKGNPIIKYAGKKIYGHNQQIGVPVVIAQMKNGKPNAVVVKSLGE